MNLPVRVSEAQEFPWDGCEIQLSASSLSIPGRMGTMSSLLLMCVKSGTWESTKLAHAAFPTYRLGVNGRCKCD